MEELKQLLRAKVINVLQDRERALKYRLAIPNGMLLYGPPGCGKTFIAEKFAEETGFNYGSQVVGPGEHLHPRFAADDRETFRRGACQGADRALFR